MPFKGEFKTEILKEKYNRLEFGPRQPITTNEEGEIPVGLYRGCGRDLRLRFSMFAAIARPFPSFYVVTREREREREREMSNYFACEASIVSYLNWKRSWLARRAEFHALIKRANGAKD